jgi:two-component system sporulation sensor kinase A
VRRSPEESNEIEIVVRDTGLGMSPEDVRTAFEPYFSTKDTGLGLGLALTHKIVADHGGSISLESAPDRGTTARVSIPVEKTPLGEKAVPAEAVGA